MDPDVLKPHLRTYDAAIMRAVRTVTGQQFRAGGLVGLQEAALTT